MKGLNALLKSRAYVKGRFWPVLGRLLLGSLVFVGTGVAVQIILGFIPIIGFVAGMLVSLTVGIGMMAYIFVLYKDVRAAAGEIVFEPDKRQKIKFVLIGVFGIIAFISYFILMSFLILKIGEGLFSNSKAAFDARRQTDISALRTRIWMYYDENGIYPDSLNDLEPMYINEVPTDPETKKPYEYRIQNNGADFEICADLETKPDVCFQSAGAY